MRNHQWKEIEEIFHQAVLIPESERNYFISQKCGNDSELCSEIISLVQADSGQNEALEQSMFPVVARLLDEYPATLSKESRFGSYVLQIVIGRGGMATVFLGKDIHLQRPVALKLMPVSIAKRKDELSGFLQEAKAASSISDPNVAHIYECGTHNGFHFLAMEYIAGKTLRVLLKENMVDITSTIKITLQICSAIRAAHNAGISHRDIKPENIMLTGEDIVKVLDFGLAKLNPKRVIKQKVETKPGFIIGTAAYMSPEQIREESIDERTDIWSIGVCLYEMLAGERPFKGETVRNVQASILQTEPALLAVETEIPKLGKIIRKSLAKDISKRYQTAEEFIEDLQVVQREVYDYVNPDKNPQ
jgi:serine/threonine-protein kinase